MPSSSQNPSRPRLGIALSRKQWEDRRSNSTSSSITSHGSDGEGTPGSFDPTNEALVSTGPLDHPAAKKEARKSPHKEYRPHVEVATMALSDASGDGSDGADMSIEVGRGGRQGQRRADDSRNDDSIHSSNAMIGDYKVMYSPPLSTHRNTLRTSNHDNARSLRHDAQIRLASMASQKENRDPAPQLFKPLQSADASKKVKRKTLGEINAQTAEIYDGSLLSDDRPTHVAPATKTTRFSRSKRNPSNPGLINATNTVTDVADMNRSYIMPDLPSQSQLMSGTQNRTPGRSRNNAHPALSYTAEGPLHNPIDAVPIPDDEKAIFASLNLLQRKVNELKVTTTGLQRDIDELKTKSLVLRAENRDLRLENDELRNENDELRAGQQVGSQPRKHEPGYRSHPSLQEQQQANVAAQVNSQILKLRNHQHQEDMFSLTPTESVKLRPTSMPSQRSSAVDPKYPGLQQDDVYHVAAASNTKNSKKVVIEENATRTINENNKQSHARQQTATQDMTYLSTHPEANYLSDLRKMLEAERVDVKKKNREREDLAAGKAESAGGGRQTTAQQALPRKSSMKDTSRRIPPSDIATATIARVHEERQNAAQPPYYHQENSEDITDQASHPLSEPGRRISDPTATATAASNTSRRRRRTTDLDDENMTSAFIIPDITLAQPATTTAAGFRDTTATVHLTDAAQHVIHSIRPHDASNCVICSRLSAIHNGSNNSANNTSPASKKTIIVPKPIPVSDTPVSPTQDNPDPTLRPAQPPGVALAIVLKELTDQHEHLKARLARAQARYQRSDPRLSRSKRGRLGREVEGLTRQCESVADMIYRLYDVVEGQKMAASMGSQVGGGWEMSQDEVEVTVMGLREVMGRMSSAGEGEEGDESGSGSGSGSEGEEREGDGMGGEMD